MREYSQNNQNYNTQKEPILSDFKSKSLEALIAITALAALTGLGIGIMYLISR